MCDKSRFSIVCFLLIFAAVPEGKLAAQNRFTGFVQSTGSDSFVVANNGRQQTYQTGTVPSSGLSLQNQDMIQTGPGNYVEAQLDPSGAMIKLAENTSIVFNDLGSTGRAALVSFLYGRMRIVNSGNTGNVMIQAGNAVVEIARGDIALDFSIIPGTSNRQPQLQVSALSGNCAVYPAGGSGGMRTPVYEGETTIFDAVSQYNVAGRQSLSQEISSFWGRNGFRQSGAVAAIQSAPYVTPPAQSSAVAGLPALGGAYNIPQTSTQAQSPYRLGVPGTDITSTYQGIGTQTDYPRPIQASDLEPMSNEKATLELKNGGVLAGALLMILGVAGQAVGHFNFVGLDSDTADKVFMFSYAPIGAGIITLFATYFYLYRYQ